MRRAAFTLLEMLIAISILSIMMIFLYKSYSTLNNSNEIFRDEVEVLENLKLKKKTLFLDFTLSKYKSIKIENLDTQNDVILMQTSNSVHKRFNPYVAYIISKDKLYRIESLRPISYPIDANSEVDVDEFGEVKRFRVFENKEKDSYIIDLEFKNSQKILLKAKALNEK